MAPESQTADDDWLFDWHSTALSAQTGCITPQEYEIYCVGRETNAQ